MRMASLQSGSNGNCTFVEADGVRLLVDAGISGRQAQQRLAALGQEIKQVDALVISHDHRDHARCMGIYQRKFGLPIYVTRKTLATAETHHALGKLRDVRYFEPGDAIYFGTLRLETHPTPHDGVDGVAFVMDDGRRRLGIMTDLGHVFDGLKDTVASLDAVMMEANYDPGMLSRGPYPQWLKRRVRGPRGHLSNVESARLIAHTCGARLAWACLAHLSGENNSPSVALRTYRQTIGPHLPLHVASRHHPTPLLPV